MKLQRMVGVYEKAVMERDEYARQMRATSVQLSHQRLTVAHLQRQVDRARRENMKLRAEVRDLSAGRQPQVLHLPGLLCCAFVAPGSYARRLPRQSTTSRLLYTGWRAT